MEVMELLKPAQESPSRLSSKRSDYKSDESSFARTFDEVDARRREDPASREVSPRDRDIEKRRSSDPVREREKADEPVKAEKEPTAAEPEQKPDTIQESSSKEPATQNNKESAPADKTASEPSPGDETEAKPKIDPALLQELNP
ncbi:MAG: hypothetical protein ABIK28_09405, partial [Planctomycetota bacterium]